MKRIRIRYRDNDPAAPVLQCQVVARNIEEALAKFFSWGDKDWTIVSTTEVEA